MTVRRPRYARIADVGRGLLDRFGVVAPPVPVERIAAELGITVRSADLGEVSGFIARRDGETIVGVNSTQSHVRRRFTLAHEIGHFLLHQDLRSHRDVDFRVKYRDRNSAGATDVEEIEANFFAALLLVPRHMLDALDAGDALGDARLVRTLARRFDVSSHAMTLRLVNEFGQHSPF